MATDINKTTLVGRVVRDTELTYTNGGLAITSGSLAVNHRPAKNSAQEVSYFDFKILGKFGETMTKYLTRGTQIAITGYLKQDRWQTQDGSNRSRVTVMVEELELLGGSNQNGNNGYQNGGNSYQDNGDGYDYGYSN